MRRPCPIDARRVLHLVTAMIIDAWIQHPTPEFINNPMFASLRRLAR
jgi:hypothetical protein